MSPVWSSAFRRYEYINAYTIANSDRLKAELQTHLSFLSLAREQDSRPPEGGTPTVNRLPDSPECGEATILVQDSHLTESHFAQQIDLIEQRPRRVLLLDVGEYLLAIGRPAQLLEIFTVARPHHGLHL